MRRQTHSGFTLIETVISLVLLSFIALIGYQGLAFGMEQWRKGHERLEFGYAYQQAIGWVRNSLGAAETLVDRRASRRDYLFDGSARGVEFFTRFDQARRGGLYVTRLFHDAADNSLQVSYYLHHPEIDPQKMGVEPDRVTILDGIVSFRMAYYGKAKGKISARWHDDWRSSYRLPQLIRLDLETVDGIKHQSIVSVLTSKDV
jgi:prepilin-type N-terminal cleavage/methylation domain-containing protein